MPLHDFRCTACGHEFEELVMGRDARVCCPRCGSDQVEKLMSTFAYRSGGKTSTPSTGGKCSGCAGGSCASCH
ncbi:MAG: zinc ribbon domain-containing protein [Thermodesulfobacteriota bacterium]